jgi:hypothetical protein
LSVTIILPTLRKVPSIIIEGRKEREGGREKERKGRREEERKGKREGGRERREGRRAVRIRALRD